MKMRLTERSRAVLGTLVWTVLMCVLILRSKFVVYMLWLNASAVCQYIHWHNCAFRFVAAADVIVVQVLWWFGWRLTNKLLWWFGSK